MAAIGDKAAGASKLQPQGAGEAEVEGDNKEFQQLRLVHEGGSFRVFYNHVLSETQNSNTDHKISVAIKSCQPVPDVDASCLYNEYNISVQRLNECSGTRKALKKEVFDAADGAGPQPAVFFDWIDGCTLTTWLANDSSFGLDLMAQDRYSSFQAKVLTRVRLAHGIASALASIHKAGVVHNDLVSDNIIVNFRQENEEGKESCAVTTDAKEKDHCLVKIIGLGYADYSADKCGQRVNTDMHALALILKEMFRQQNWGGDSYPEAGRGSATSDFGRALVHDKGRFFCEKKPSSTGSTCSTDDTHSETEKMTDEMLGLVEHQAASYIEEDQAHLVRNLPQSIQGVVADAMNIGQGTRNTAYKTAQEVVEDLEQMISDPAIFLLDPDGEETKRSTLRRPPKTLCGRQKEMEILTRVCNKLTDVNRNESTEVVTISGQSGTGKSALLQNLRDNFLIGGGLFAMGKFDQLKHTQPYSALSIAFSELCESLLAQEDAVLDNIRADIILTLGPNAKVLTDVIPRMIDIIGTQSDVPHLRGIEAQNRFQYVFQLLVSAVTSPERPLVLVLDDIQWADSASIELVHSLVNDETNKHFLFIAAFRDNEMNSESQVCKKLDELKNCGAPLTTIKLGNLTEEEVNTCVSERLHLPRRITKPLADIVHRKTLGNAFFVTQFICSLADEGGLTFSAKKLRWEWNEAEADGKNISDNVIEVMAQKILSLQDKARHALVAASCIGSRFGMATLQALSDTFPPPSDGEYVGYLDSEDLLQVLRILVKQGLIIKSPPQQSWYRFSHDRIQQAAYSLLSKNERNKLHFQIGQIFKEQLESGRTSLIFSAVDQLNRALDLIKDKNKQMDLAHLNVHAGEEAFLACAFSPATMYLKKALQLLGGDHLEDWGEHYSLILQLYNLLAEVAYCRSDFCESEHFAHQIFENAKNLDDKFTAHVCLIKSLVGKGRLDDGLNAGLELLRHLGEPLPANPSKRAKAIELFKTKRCLMKKSDKFLMELPHIPHGHIPKVIQAMALIVCIARILVSDYFVLSILRMIQLSLQFGSTEVIAPVFALYGTVLYTCGDTKEAYRFGRLSLALLDQVEASSVHAKGHFFAFAFIMHWYEPVQALINPLSNVHQVGLEVGDVEYASYGILNMLIVQLHSGQSIDVLLNQRKKYLPKVTKAVLDMVLATYQAALNLSGESADHARLNGEAMTEEGLLKRSVEKHNPMSEYYYRLNAACIAYVFCDYDLAAEHSIKIQDFALRFPAVYAVNVQAFYDGLASFALARKVNSRKWRLRGRKSIKKFQKWMKDCPHNNMHKVLLLKAENAALLGAKSQKKRKYAKATFDAAISAASKNGFVNDEAIACERAALFHSEIGEESNFWFYMARSHELFLRWGAKGKAQVLAKQYPSLN